MKDVSDKLEYNVLPKLADRNADLDFQIRKHLNVVGVMVFFTIRMESLEETREV